ncbi:MAG TPA: glycosyltransferase family 2 protein, partial [Tepidisphaeraceae bacterium]|nr:glycosyltransferase family 2 protein [Tepidisphaeraceae bacterium]
MGGGTRNPMKLLVVIVNYRSADLAIDCLASLAPQVRNDMRIIITDNQSPDDSVAKLAAVIERNGWSAWATLRPLDRNGGFAYGNNRGIEPALAADDKPQYILLLNPDTVLRPGAVQTLIDFMDANPTVGIAGSRLEDPDGTPQVSAFRFHSIAGEIERSMRLGVVTRLLSNAAIAPPVSNEAGPCDWVAGASMIIRREVFERIGLMDEKYFMYFEEVDFCLQAKRVGWPCWYVPSSRVVHLVGAVSQMSDARKHRKRRPAYWFESRRRYFVKNHGWLYAAMADLAFMVGFTLWRIRRLVQRKDDPDPPKLLLDSLAHSVFVRGRTV